MMQVVRLPIHHEEMLQQGDTADGNQWELRVYCSGFNKYKYSYCLDISQTIIYKPSNKEF